MYQIIGDNEMDWKTFIKAGRAKFTLENVSTGNRLTFRVNKHEDKDLWFVSVLNGPDNENSFMYVGTIFDKKFKLTKKSRVGPTSQSYLTFKWLNDILNSDDDIPETVRFYHAGRCGRCGRELTVPASIECGFGPECVGLVYGDNPHLAGHIPLETSKKIGKILKTANELNRLQNSD